MNDKTCTHSDTASTVKKKKFEIEIYDKVSVGEPPYDTIRLEKVHYDKPITIEASSEQDLQEFQSKLNLCNQTFKIVKVLECENDKQEISAQHVQQKTEISVNTCKHEVHEEQQLKPSVISCAPKFYKIGDVEIKNVGGKIYQKQWMRLSSTEMSNLRIVNDKTNSIFNLKDKHIEIKRWILVEDSAEDDMSGKLDKEISCEGEE